MPTRTYWYVDLENVHNNFISMLDKMKQHDHIFIFYSQSADSLKISTYEAIVRAMLHPHFIKVVTSGKNSMDFAIMVEMGRNSVLHPEIEHNCITGDMGFLAGVKHLQTYGVKSSSFSPLTGLPAVEISPKEHEIIKRCKVQNWSREQRLRELNKCCAQTAGPDGKAVSALFHKLKSYVE